MANVYQQEPNHVRSMLNAKGINTYCKMFENMDDNKVISLPKGIKVLFDQAKQWFYYESDGKKLQICPYEGCAGYVVGRMCTHMRNEFCSSDITHYVQDEPLFHAGSVNIKDIEHVIKLVRHELQLKQECNWKEVCDKLEGREGQQVVLRTEKVVVSLPSRDSKTVQIATREFSFFKCANEDTCYKHATVQSGISWYCSDHVQPPVKFSIFRHRIQEFIYPIMLIACHRANNGMDVDINSKCQWIETLRFIFVKGSAGFGMLTEVANVKIWMTKTCYLYHTCSPKHSSKPLKLKVSTLCLFPHCLRVLDSCNESDKNKDTSGVMKNRLCELHKEQTQLPSNVAEIFKNIEYDGTIIFK